MAVLFPETIETDRLRLEAIRLEAIDVFDLYDICANDPSIDEVTKHLPWDPHTTPKETAAFVESVTEKLAANEGGTYLIRPRAGEDGAGTIAGIADCDVDWDRRTMTLATWLRKPFWGRRYSGERAGAFLTLAFDRLDLELVAIKALVDNEKSNRAIERYVEAHGGRREGVLRHWRRHDGEPANLYRYSVSHEEWESNATEAPVTFLDEPAGDRPGDSP